MAEPVLPTARDRANAALALGLLSMGVLQIAVTLPEPLVLLLLAALVTLNRSRLSRSATVVATLVVLALVAMALTGDLSDSAALTRVIFLAALLVALNMLSLAASRSGDVQQAAQVVASRPRGTRYAFVTLGTHLFSIFLNFGSISVMASLLAQSRDRLVHQNALEDITLAMLRGFAAMPMWSPLALSTIITLSIMPQVSYLEVLPYGLVGAVLYMLAGYFLARGGTRSAEVPTALPAPEDRRVLARVMLRILALMVLSVGLYRLADLTLPQAVLLSVLAFSLAWWVTQHRAHKAPPLLQDAGSAAATSVNEILIVSGAGALGSAISYGIAQASTGLAAPPAALVPLIVALTPTLMVLCGLVAINPIVSASVILGVLLPLIPGPALMWLAVAVKIGWGITAAASPFTANVLIASRLLAVDGTRIARVSNRRLTLLALTLTGVFCGFATHLTL